MIKRILSRLARPVRRYWNTDHDWEGRLLELLGNRARIDGAILDVSNPLIPTRDKAPLLKRTYERPERLLMRHLPLRFPLIELGANIGALACIANRRLHSPTQHVVIEANPELIPILERNRTLNSAQFRIEQMALAYDVSEITFYLADKLVASSLIQSKGRPVTVRTTTLAQIAARAGFTNFSVICDIEGAEAGMIEQEIDLMRDCIPCLILEHHPKLLGRETADRLHQMLVSAGLEVRERRGQSVCYMNPRLLAQS
jgi:FkbM family methyltransferase